MFKKLTKHVYVRVYERYTDRHNNGFICGTNRAWLYDAGKLAWVRSYLTPEGIPIVERKRRAEQILFGMENRGSRYRADVCSVLAQKEETTMKERKWAFDLEVEGTESETRTIDWLLNLSDTAIACQDWESAVLLLDRASASAKGQLKLADLYLNPKAELEIPVAERQEKAKQLLLGLANEEGVCAADACVMLASLYACRPLAAVSYRLKVERLKNGCVDGTKIQQLVPRIRRLGSDHPYGAYMLATELEHYQGHDILALKKELYQIAAEAEYSFAGIASLRLSELNDGDACTALKYKKIAEKKGFPAILMRN